MTISGIPILALVLIAVAAVSVLFMIRQPQALTRQLGAGSSGSPEGQVALQGALYAGEMRLHDLGVHRTVWMIRWAFIFETLCILAVVYLIYTAEVVQ